MSSLDMGQIWSLKDDVAHGKVHPRDAKMQLAFELVKKFHGTEEAEAARAAFVAQFSRKEIPDDIPEFAVEAVLETIYLPRVLKDAGILKSASEGRRLIRQGAVSIDGQKIDGEEITPDSSEIIIKVGKRRYLRLVRR